MEGKLIIFSAPSGSGKTTLVKYILEQNLNLQFSVSAASRPPRKGEVNGVDYIFITPTEFRQKIDNNEFLEWEEVYKDKFYGSLKSSVEKMLSEGKNVLFDIDVKGGINIKKYFGNKALSIFVQPPSIEELQKRLETRGTDTQDVIAERVKKASYELEFVKNFDYTIINDNLDIAKKECLSIISKFIKQ